VTLWPFRVGPADELLAFCVGALTSGLPRTTSRSRAHPRPGAGGCSTATKPQRSSPLDGVSGEPPAGRSSSSRRTRHPQAIERRVTEIAGEVGGKLHTGRSRNDQVATALRLVQRSRAVAARVIALQHVARAVEVGDASLPGYTHVQRAQPVLLAHHLLAHGWALARDVDRLVATITRLDVSPLGAGALAGSSLPLDHHGTAADLGFGAAFENSLDAVSDRDFVAEALFDLSLLGVHLSRIGEEWVLWTSAEFGYAVLDDAYATGSSMMPQKKNADIAELARGKAGRLIGHVSGFLATLKGLPLSYNRDLQEDKEPLFDAVDQVRCTRALTGWSRSDRSICHAGAPPMIRARGTGLAELLNAGCRSGGHGSRLARVAVA
jgi:argininosuccinate lyase